MSVRRDTVSKSDIDEFKSLLTISTGHRCYRTSKCPSYRRSTSRSATIHSAHLRYEPMEFVLSCLVMTTWMQLCTMQPHQSIFYQFLSTLFLTKLAHLLRIVLSAHNLLNLHLPMNLDIINLHLYLHLTRFGQKVALLVHLRSDYTRAALNNTRPQQDML